MKRLMRQAGRSLATFGIDPRRLLSLRNIPRYLGDRSRFKAAGGRIDLTHMVLDGYDEQAGSARGHYFHQDLLVAGLVFRANPRRHIDVGSRIDGFVAHVASFRSIEVMDIRPLASDGLHNIRFVQGDLMAEQTHLAQSCDSLSCLHALEHFGLGRYGDPIVPDGHRRGFRNLVRMLQPGGTLYLSIPIGTSAVHFNAHRVFDVHEVPSWSQGLLELQRFDFVDDDGSLHVEQTPEAVGELRYGCGIYTLRKAG